MSQPTETPAFLPGDSVAFPCGLTMRNRFMLAPLTNTQSHEDGRLSDDEFRWLTMRARGGFGITMTCAAHVQAVGKGFPGQLGVFSDDHLEGLTHLATAIREAGSLAIVQLHHAGLRSPVDIIGEGPQSASDDPKSGARGLALKEVEQLRDDFIAAAVRSKQAGFHGVEIHGAHGYIIAQFLSAKYNRRDDRYGGTLDNRARLLKEIVEGVRSQCGPEFFLGVRLSPERFGMRLDEMLEISGWLVGSGAIDLLDMSLWDVFKQPHEEEHQGQSLLEHVAALPRGDVKMTVAGNIRSGEDVASVLASGIDIVTIGRGAILHHDFPRQVLAEPGFHHTELPVSRAYLKRQGLGDSFVDYMGKWDGFVGEAG